MIGFCTQTHIGRRTGAGVYHPIWYVAGIPHPKGSKAALRYGVDWEWTDDRSKAIDLSLYWQRRFRRDCERTNRQAQFA